MDFDPSDIRSHDEAQNPVDSLIDTDNEPQDPLVSNVRAALSFLLLDVDNSVDQLHENFVEKRQKGISRNLSWSNLCFQFNILISDENLLLQTLRSLCSVDKTAFSPEENSRRISALCASIYLLSSQPLDSRTVNQILFFFLGEVRQSARFAVFRLTLAPSISYQCNAPSH